MGSAEKSKLGLKQFWVLIPVSILFIVLLWPRAYPLFNQLTVDTHRSAMCLEAALYSYSDHLLPLKDIYSQYGVGQGFACRFLLTDSVRTTVDRFDLLHDALLFIFFMGLFSFCFVWTRSVAYAIAISLGVFFLQFITHSGFDHTFHAPSMGAYRYPMLPFAALALLGLLRSNYLGRRWFIFLFLLLLATGMQVFWITDAGVATLLAVLSTLFVSGFGKTGYSLKELLRNSFVTSIFLAATLGIFLALVLLAYGSAFFEMNFREFFLFLKVYSAGFGGAPAQWYFEPNFLIMNLFSLHILIASAGWTLTRGRNANAETWLLFFLSTFGIVIRAKMSNRTMGAYFFGDAVAFIGVTLYWVMQFTNWLAAKAASRSLLSGIPRPLALAAQFAVPLIVVFGYLVTPQDRIFDNRSGLYAYFNAYMNLEFPWFLKRSFSIPDTVSSAPAEEEKRKFVAADETHYTILSDLKLIHKYVPAGTPLVVFSHNDWVYTLEAQRPPGLYFMPLQETFLKRGFKNLISQISCIPYLFVDNTDKITPSIKEAKTEVFPFISSHFEKLETGSKLTAFKNRHASCVDLN